MKNTLTHHKYTLFIINLLISLLISNVAIFCRHYSVDDYGAIYNSLGGAVAVASSYRVPIAILYYVIDDVLGWNTTVYQAFFLFLFIIVASVAITLMTLRIGQIIDECDAVKLIIIESAFFLLFENAFFSEWLWFAGGAIQWAASVMCAVIAACIFNDDEKSKTQRCIAGAILLVLGVGSYQLCLVQFMYCFLILKLTKVKGEINKELVLDFLKVSLISVLAFIINVIMTKIAVVLGLTYATPRLSSEKIQPIELVKEIIFAFLRILWTGFDYYPRTLLLGFILIFMILTGRVIAINDHKLNKTLALVLSAMCGIGVMGCACFVEGKVELPPRVFMHFFGAFTCLLVIPLSYERKTKDVIYKCLAIVAVIFVYINIASIQVTSVDASITRALDEDYYGRVYQAIKEYEGSSGEVVTKVGICYDSVPHWKYYNRLNMPVQGDLAVSAKYASFSWLNSMNYYLNSHYEAVEVPEDISNMVLDKNWEEENLKEQLIFENDTVYICAY